MSEDGLLLVTRLLGELQALIDRHAPLWKLYIWFCKTKPHLTISYDSGNLREAGNDEILNSILEAVNDCPEAAVMSWQVLHGACTMLPEPVKTPWWEPGNLALDLHDQYDNQSWERVTVLGQHAVLFVKLALAGLS